jgi:ferredoxin
MVLYKFIVDESKCMNCGACMDLCPPTCLEFTRALDTSFHDNIFDSQAQEEPKIWMMEKPYLPIQERCTGCQVCVRECPTNAITVEPDSSKPSSLRPKPVILKSDSAKRGEDCYWHPLSEFTRDYLKRPVRSPWSAIAEWKPMIRERRIHETWRTMMREEKK